jgi:hypothetical protein
MCMSTRARTLLSVVALAGASSSLHTWSISAVRPALDEHDLDRALTGAHCRCAESARDYVTWHTPEHVGGGGRLKTGACAEFRHKYSLFYDQMVSHAGAKGARHMMSTSTILRCTHKIKLTTASFCFLGVAWSTGLRGSFNRLSSNQVRGGASAHVLATA